jgi:hypothetical protein
MVNAKMIAKIRQRTLLALLVTANGVAAAVIGWATAPGRCREALGRAMVRTSIYYFCVIPHCRFRAALMSTIEGWLITV